MDGISAVASVLQVVQICAVTIKLFADLRAACRTLPGRLEALEHEVLDLKAVLKDVEGVANERKGLQTRSGEDRARFDQLLNHSTGKLNALQRLLVELTEATKGSRIALVKANAWRKVQGRLKALQDEIQGDKTNLNILLGASTSYAYLSCYTRD
jgi:DNA repair exonuclease SbcCD ATPase subunit